MKKIDYVAASITLIGMTGGVLIGLNPMRCSAVSLLAMTIYVTVRLVMIAVKSIREQCAQIKADEERIRELEEEMDRRNKWRNFDLKAMAEARNAVK